MFQYRRSMADPAASSDPVVREVARRYAVLAAEAAALDRVLAAYASVSPREIPQAPTVSALEHYPFSEGAECGCGTCAEWTLRRGEFIDASRIIPKGHKWSTCTCVPCRFVGRIHLNYLAATNTRDLLIETSFHARYHSPFGAQVMEWLDVELRKPSYTLNWRAQEMSRFPLEWWLRRCEAALGPVVSGEVFGSNMGVDRLPAHFASSLLADGALSA